MSGYPIESIKMFEDSNNTTLARWLANELTPEEMKEFKASTEYARYEAIVRGLARLEKPAFDSVALKERIQNKIQTSNSGKLISLKQVVRITAVAASILLIITIFFNKVTYTTGIGETEVISLPDGTLVRMNSGSTLERKRFFWSSQRELFLEGEALFKVTSGDDFIVNTAQGEVAVLGTIFNLRSRKTSLNLDCYEGKVQYIHNNTQEISLVTAGNAIEVVDHRITPGKAGSAPSWTAGQSQFKSTPLADVLEELQFHYDIDIDTKTIDANQLFTGNFSTNDLEFALRTISLTMGLKYRLSEDAKSVIFYNP